ncbi:MAG: HAMP domain-containing sensor histidine kinase [Cyanobacteria bacterium P01_D01_bin.73]
MNLLIQSLGVTAGGMYWAESDQAERSPRWVPILVYPEHVWDDELPALSPQAQVISPRSFEQIEPDRDNDSDRDKLIDGELVDRELESHLGASKETPNWHLSDQSFVSDQSFERRLREPQESNQPQNAIVAFPGHQQESNNYQLLRSLASDGNMLGLLVLERMNRPWTLGEQKQVAQVVKTLEAGFILVRRQQWLESSFAEREQFYEVQRDRLHDLLHQFKSPLTAIRTFGKLLLKRFQGDEKTITVANQVLQQSDRLKGMLKNFSDIIDLDPIDVQSSAGVSRSRMPELPAGPDAEIVDDAANGEPVNAPQPLALLPTNESDRPFSLGELLANLVETAQLLAREAQVTLDYRESGPLPDVMGDRAILQETIGNVIDNALKYTPAGGQVRIQTAIAIPRCHRQWSELTDPVPGGVEDALLQRSPNSQRPQLHPHVVVHIQDSGLGISADDLQQLFSRRFRGDKTDSDIPGTGLGLAIVRDTLEAIGGAIELFSPAIALNSLSLTIGDTACTTLAPFADADRSTGTSVILWLPVKNLS